ncbi:hypothetical protein, partial [Serratia sp. CY35562]|uniref:hypothetical protein n=1 Tax=Serratia sp. CY35562 TaxID=3383606 RepID=UPI003FA097FA
FKPNPIVRIAKDSPSIRNEIYLNQHNWRSFNNRKAKKEKYFHIGKQDRRVLSISSHSPSF